MNRCLNDLRDSRIPHGGVGGATSMSQHAWRLALFAPKPLGTDAAILPVSAGEPTVPQLLRLFGAPPRRRP